MDNCRWQSTTSELALMKYFLEAYGLTRQTLHGSLVKTDTDDDQESPCCEMTVDVENNKGTVM